MKLSTVDWDTLHWEYCTFDEHAEKRIHDIVKVCNENNLLHITSKIQDKSAKILDLGSGHGVMINFLLQNGFENVRGIDYNPKHLYEYPDIDEHIILGDIRIDNSSEEHLEDYDIVLSHLSFDSGAYPSQNYTEYPQDIFEGIGNLIAKNGIYYASERHDKEKIRTGIISTPRDYNVFLGEYPSRGEFFPNNKKTEV